MQLCILQKKKTKTCKSDLLKRLLDSPHILLSYLLRWENPTQILHQDLMGSLLTREPRCTPKAAKHTRRYWNYSRAEIHRMPSVKLWRSYGGVRKRFREEHRQPWQQRVGRAAGAHVSEHHGPERENDPQSEEKILTMIQPSSNFKLFQSCTKLEAFWKGAANVFWTNLIEFRSFFPSASL